NLLTEDEIYAEDIIQKTGVRNLDIMPSDPRLSATQVMLANDVRMQFKLKRKISDLEGYDYIFIDTPPSVGLLTLNALTAADKVLIPIQTHYFAMDGVANLIKTIDAVKEDINPGLEFGGVVLTMYDRRTKLSAEVTKAVKEAFKDKVFSTIIPINVKLAESPSHHKPIAYYASWSTGAKAYEKLAEEFMR
ncbi:MAG: ParA family protein, partial [Nanoarchaeota archaeon]|nr:ParA family protein [Nanoarchaeota archaeon]